WYLTVRSRRMSSPRMFRLSQTAFTCEARARGRVGSRPWVSSPSVGLVTVTGFTPTQVRTGGRGHAPEAGTPRCGHTLTGAEAPPQRQYGQPPVRGDVPRASALSTRSR